MKNWKTTLVGIIGMLFLVIGVILVIYKVITFTELIGSLAIVSTFLVSMNGFVGKDGDVTGGSRQQ